MWNPPNNIEILKGLTPMREKRYKTISCNEIVKRLGTYVQ